MKCRIVSDSSSNVMKVDGNVSYATVPLKIIVDSTEFVDQEGVDVESLVAKMENSQLPSTTSCPNTNEWLEAFNGAENVFAITISSQLSGSYNAAVTAAEEYRQENPGANVYVIDSLSTGGEMELIIEKLIELMDKDMTFDEMVKAVQEYQRSVHLLFLLQSLSNLAKNGRLSPAVAKIAGFLGLRFLGVASEEGTIQQESISRGNKKALTSTFEAMKKYGYNGGKVRIDHCLDLGSANKLAEKIKEEFPNADVRIRPSTALCSYYSERGGMILGFEC